MPAAPNKVRQTALQVANQVRGKLAAFSALQAGGKAALFPVENMIFPTSTLNTV
jgi:hypothetical protein